MIATLWCHALVTRSVRRIAATITTPELISLVLSWALILDQPLLILSSLGSESNGQALPHLPGIIIHRWYAKLFYLNMNVVENDMHENFKLHEVGGLKTGECWSDDIGETGEPRGKPEKSLHCLTELTP